jgi:hypothetical protein
VILAIAASLGYFLIIKKKKDRESKMDSEDDKSGPTEGITTTNITPPTRLTITPPMNPKMPATSMPAAPDRQTLPAAPPPINSTSAVGDPGENNEG